MSTSERSPRRRPAPKYEIVANSLERRVRAMQPHEGLRTERRLMEEYGVSRVTVRQAIQLLIRKGLVYKVQGSGTYVADPAFVTKSLRLTGFSEDMRQRGMEPASTVLSYGTVPASTETAAALDVAPETPLVSVSRLRLADGMPMAIENVFVLADLIDPDELDASGSLYEQLKLVDINVSRATQTIRAVNLDPYQAKLLDQAVGAAALLVARVTFSDRGQQVEYAETIYRGDRYNFDIVVRRDL
ncbi:GntR family transcriptional regulator [Micromonospora sp. NPDC005305]|uniref:GntR family transcriptional regulator n=1 Tax=Micromonospora sp. NPDC005305 TaxID=3156875 RepID=UPI0033B831A3